MLGIACAGSPAAGATPQPRVTGPLPVSAASYPFGAADHQLVPQDLRRRGYVEEEYLVSGKANVYDWPAPGPAVVRTADAPYTTRILVRRPAKRARFSGNVVVELLNPSNLFDLNIGWGLAHRQLLRNGDVWVGVTVKPVSVVALKTFDPAALRVSVVRQPAAARDPRNCASVAADSSRTTENGLAWDIFTQVGAWVRGRSSGNPLLGPASRAPLWIRLLADRRLPVRLRQRHPSAGRPRTDGRRSTTATSWPWPAGRSSAPCRSTSACPPPPLGDPRRQFTNVGVPIIHVMSQSDYLIGIGARRPDSDAPADRYRHYEMAGAGHATPDELYYSAAPGRHRQGRPSGPAAQRATRARAAGSPAASSSTPS